MKTLTKTQKKILKNIPNKKSRAEQKTQFKLQNAHDRQIVFTNGLFKTDSKKMQKFLSKHPFFGFGGGDGTSTTVQLDLTDFNKKVDEIPSDREQSLNSLLSLYKPQKIYEKEKDFGETLRNITEPKTENVDQKTLLDKFIENCENHLKRELSISNCIELKDLCVKKSQFHLASKFRDRKIALEKLVETAQVEQPEKTDIAQKRIALKKEIKYNLSECIGSASCGNDFEPSLHHVKFNLTKLLHLTNQQLAITKTDFTPKKTNDAPKEFCVKITDENKNKLEVIWNDFHKEKNMKLAVGFYMHSNSLFTYMIQSSSMSVCSAVVFIEKPKLVSTEEFLSYIGKEELIEKPKTKAYNGFAFDPLLHISDEAGHRKQVTYNQNKLRNDVVPKSQKDVKAQTENINYRETPLTSDECVKPKTNICDRQQNLFNYLSNECSFTALQSQMNDIEDIVKKMIKSTETVETKTYTLEDMKNSFLVGRIAHPRVMNGIKSNDYGFDDFLKTLHWSKDVK
jgi:hypothetical protein